MILFVRAMPAIVQLKIDTEIVLIVTGFVLGGATLGCGLAFGLGTGDIVRNPAAHLVVEANDRESAIANATIPEQVAKQGPRQS